MGFVLRMTEPQEHAVPIDMGDAGSFEVIVRPTTAGEELSVLISGILDGGDAAVLRTLNSIVGWRGVNDPSGREIPFSRDALACLFRTVPPSVGMRIISAVSAFYSGSESDRKNSEPPFSDSCGTADGASDKGQ